MKYLKHPFGIFLDMVRNKFKVSGSRFNDKEEVKSYEMSESVRDLEMLALITYRPFDR